MNNRMKFRIIILIFLITAVISSAVYAETITLTDAFLTALNNNMELKEKANEIDDLKKDLKIIRAQQSWDIELSGEYNEIINEAENTSLRSINNNLDAGGRTAVNINKEFTSGLTLNQEFSYSEDNQENYYISFVQPLLPVTDSSLEQEYFRKSRELLMTESEYINLKENKIIEWVGSYLNILRLRESQNNLEKSVTKAAEHLEKLKQKEEINEAGKSEIFASEIVYLDAEKSYFDIKNQLINEKNYFVLNLGLNKDQNIIYDKEAGLLNFLEKNLINYDKNSIVDLYDKLTISDKELKIQQINLNILEKNLAWQKDDSKINLDLNGSYDKTSKESIVGLSLSYDFYDGGAAELREQKIIEDIKLQEEKIALLEKDKLLQLKIRLNNLESAKRVLKRDKLSLLKAEHEFEINIEQFNDGLLAELEVLESEINYYSSLNNYNKSRDQLLIEELNLMKIISDQIVNTERWRDNGE